MKTTNESPLKTDRTNAMIAGVLFIIGTVSGLICVVIGKPVWNAPDYLQELPANVFIINLAAFLQFTMGIACAGIAIALYPTLKKYAAGLALGAVGFRLLENMLQILYAVSMVTLLAIGQQLDKAGPVDAAYLQSLGQIITTTNDWMIHGVALICFSIGAALYYMVFFQHRLVPRWLSIWGLIAISLVPIGSVLVMFGVIPGFGTVQMLINLPIFPQEMVLAVWLIVKGLAPAPMPSTPTFATVQSALN
jgi:hypothetical protein